jgi:uncharacterized membrane protein YbaN (DUF454 family)
MTMVTMKENETMRRDDYLMVGILSLTIGIAATLLPILWNYRPIIFTVTGMVLWFYLVQRFADWLRHRAIEKRKWKIEKEPELSKTTIDFGG